MVIDLAAPGAVAPFRVLVVSDRATCRGPATQRLLAAHLRAGGWDGEVVIGAAGASATAGEPMHPDTARALAELDVDAGGHVARRLTERRVVQADLVLTVAHGQTRHVTSLRPEAARRTFALPELVRLAAALGPGVPPAITERVAALDGLRPVTGGASVVDGPGMTVDDPAGGGYADHRRMVRLLDGLTLQVARVLTAPAPAGLAAAASKGSAGAAGSQGSGGSGGSGEVDDVIVIPGVVVR
jgi:protein-tyrosine phosphatase